MKFLLSSHRRDVHSSLHASFAHESIEMQFIFRMPPAPESSSEDQPPPEPMFPVCISPQESFAEDHPLPAPVWPSIDLTSPPPEAAPSLRYSPEPSSEPDEMGDMVHPAITSPWENLAEDHPWYPPPVPAWPFFPPPPEAAPFFRYSPPPSTEPDEMEDAVYPAIPSPWENLAEHHPWYAPPVPVWPYPHLAMPVWPAMTFIPPLLAAPSFSFFPWPSVMPDETEDTVHPALTSPWQNHPWYLPPVPVWPCFPPPPEAALSFRCSPHLPSEPDEMDDAVHPAFTSPWENLAEDHPVPPSELPYVCFHSPPASPDLEAASPFNNFQ